MTATRGRGRGRASGNNTDEREVHQGAAPDPTEQLAKAMEIFSISRDGEPDWAKLNLHGKIAAISGFLGRIPKNGFNRFNNYSYVLESDLVEAIRYYLAAARILIFPEAIREHTVFTFEGQTTGQGRARDILTDNIIVYRVTDGYTGESFTFEVNGQGSDPRDKGANKASTSAMKFAYLRLFNISSGEDEPEADAEGDARQAGAAGQPQSPVAVGAPSNNGEVARGGRQAQASAAQIKAVSNLSNQLSLGAEGLVSVIKRVLNDEVQLPENPQEHGKSLAAYLTSKSGEDVGKLIYTLQETIKAAGDPGDSYGS